MSLDTLRLQVGNILRGTGRKRACCCPAGRRRLWTSRSVIKNIPEELVEACPTPQMVSSADALMFTISRNLPPNALSTLVKQLQDLPVPVVGCLSLGSEDTSAPYSLSYAFHQSTSNTTLELVVPFRSEIRGTPRIALGREVKQMEMHVDDTEWAGKESVAPEELPSDLAGLDRSLISKVVYFSDGQPQGLMKTFERHLPGANKIGLLASETPFSTGRPYTLILNKGIHSTGAVGLAICHYPSRQQQPCKIDYGNLRPLGGPLEITLAKGNIILELASSNATRLLLDRIQQSLGAANLTKEEGFYVAMLPDGRDEASLSEMVSVRPLIAGDPSRGALSLDTEANVQAGQKVQFYHARQTESTRSRSSTMPSVSDEGHSGSPQRERSTEPNLNTLGFGNNAQANWMKAISEADQDLKIFHAVSEGGFIVGHPNQSAWICSVDGSQGTLEM